ncbi:MAG TPA: hypothetical protein VH442_15135, partial [Micromonosporaceae bacterium]
GSTGHGRRRGLFVAVGRRLRGRVVEWCDARIADRERGIRVAVGIAVGKAGDSLSDRDADRSPGR